MSTGITLLVADDHVLFRQGIQALLRDYPDVRVVGEASNGMEALERCRALQPDVALIDAELPLIWPVSHHPSGASNGSSAPLSVAVHKGERPNGSSLTLRGQRADELGNDLTKDLDEMPDEYHGGIVLTRRLRDELPATKVALLSSQTERSDLIYEAIRAGALGFVAKMGEVEELVTAIRTVAKGQASIAVGSLTKLVTILGNQSLGGQDTSHPPEESLSEREEEVLELVAKGYGNREIALALCISESTVRSHLHNILGKLQLSNRVQAATYALTSRRRRASRPGSRGPRKGLSVTSRAPLSQPRAS